MGLDAVELVMEVEDAFEIEIPSDLAVHLLTVGDLFEYVKSQAQKGPVGTCLTAATFYRLRNAIEASGIETRFGPSSPLGEVFPKQNRRKLWAAIAKNANLRLPDLVRPSWVVFLSSAFLICSSLLAFAWLSNSDLYRKTFLLSCIGSFVALGVFTVLVTRPMANEFGSQFKTFRGLSESVLTLNLNKIKTVRGPMGANDIWVVLRSIIVRELGVDIDEVTPEARFVKDLGME